MELRSSKENIRIDKYLSDNLDYSREFIQKLIEQDLILVNNKKVKASYKLNINDLINIKIEEYENKDIDIKPVNIPLDIVYEDEYLMVINKPTGLVVHPGAGNYNNTLVNALMYYTKNLSDVG